MSFLYRPTPVVSLGNGAYSSRNVMNRLPGSVMSGIPAGASALGAASPTGRASAMRRVNTRMQPWLKTSGTMGSFIPNGLGQQDDSGIDWASIDTTPIVPDFTPAAITAPDLGPGIFQPNLPVLIGPSSGPLPPAPIDTSMYSAPNVLVAPPAGAGPTGSGIPGTQPLNPINLVAPATSLLNSIKNFFTPSAPAAPAYRGLPGYGGQPVSSSSLASSGFGAWFTQKTIIPSLPNWGVLAIGVIALSVLGGAATRRGR